MKDKPRLCSDITLLDKCRTSSPTRVPGDITTTKIPGLASFEDKIIGYKCWVFIRHIPEHKVIETFDYRVERFG